MSKNTLYKNCDTLGVLQNLDRKFNLIYLDTPYYSGGREIVFNDEGKSIKHLIAEENGCKLADVGERRQILEQNNLEEYINYIVQLLIACKNRLMQNGILCFWFQGRSIVTLIINS